MANSRQIYHYNFDLQLIKVELIYFLTKIKPFPFLKVK